MTSHDDKKMLLSIIDEAMQKGARQHKICDLLCIPVRTVQRWRKGLDDNRQYRIYEPKNKLTPEERENILNAACSNRFVDMSPKEIVPILAEEGTYLGSESTFYRVLREERLLHHRAKSREPRNRHKVKELKATGPNQVWSWDISYLKKDIKGQYYFLYLFMDIWSRKIVAYDVFKEESSENAKDILLRIKPGINLDGIHLHSDNGSPMKGSTFLATLQSLGVIPSFSRPRCSNDNAFSESLFKTIKYRSNYPDCFKSLDGALDWMSDFVTWYNSEHRHSGIKYVTPNERHEGKDKAILAKRAATYLKAQARTPERFISGKTRNWDWIEEETLNPDKEKDKKKRQVA